MSNFYRLSNSLYFDIMTTLPEFSKESITKSTLWAFEYFPEVFDENGDYPEALGYEALRFNICVLDALGETSVKPAMMEGLVLDQIDDAAIYYGLKRAAEFRRKTDF